MFWFYATARKIEIKKSDTLVSDSVNVYPCQFQFSSDWEELTKTAVFRAGSQAIEVILDDNMQCNIPWEVLLKDKLDLYVGCYGTKGEDIILNTTWTNLGKIYEGTKNKAVPGEEPTPDIITQISSQIGDLSSLETIEKSSLVGAINENVTKIKNILENYSTIPNYKTIESISSSTINDWSEIATIDDIGKITKIHGIISSSNNTEFICVPNMYTSLKFVLPNKLMFMTEDPEQLNCPITVTIEYSET